MAKFEIAHISEQGQDIIIVPLKSDYSRKNSSEQNSICTSLQACATGAGLAGKVVPVWDAGGGRIGFLAPTPWHSFFKSLTLSNVAMNINKELRCG